MRVLATSFWIEPEKNGDGLDQRRLSTAVFADQKSDSRIKSESVELFHGGYVERILAEVVDGLPSKLHLADEPVLHR